MQQLAPAGDPSQQGSGILSFIKASVVTLVKR